MENTQTVPVELEYRERTLHPAGTFPATVTAYEGREGAFGKRIMWALDTGMIAENGDPLPPLSLWTSQNIGGKSKLAQFLQALGLQVPKSQEEAARFNLRAALGKECLIQIEHQEKDNGVWANIIGVMRTPARRVQPAPREQVPDPEPPPAEGE